MGNFKDLESPSQEQGQRTGTKFFITQQKGRHFRIEKTKALGRHQQKTATGSHRHTHTHTPHTGSQDPQGLARTPSPSLFCSLSHPASHSHTGDTQAGLLQPTHLLLPENLPFVHLCQPSTATGTALLLSQGTHFLVRGEAQQESARSQGACDGDHEFRTTLR